MADAARAQRLAALEAKKKRLEQLKLERNRRVNAAGGGSSQESGSVRSLGPGSNLDEYIDSLLKTAAPQVPGATPPTPVSVKEPPSENGGPKPPEQPSPAPAPAPVPVAEKPAEPAPTKNESTQVIAVAAPPEAAKKEVETFTIATQTEDDDFPPSPEDEEEDDDDKKKKDGEENGGDQEKNDTKEAEGDEAGAGDATLSTVTPRLLSTEEKEQAVAKAPFSNFLNSASKRVERLLGAHLLSDLLVDVGYADEGDDDKTGESKASDANADEERYSAGGLVTARASFECGKWTATRDCTDIDWSTSHRELMLAGYRNPSTAAYHRHHHHAHGMSIRDADATSSSLMPRSGELLSDGLAVLWNLTMPNRPEHVFTFGSPILRTKFHPTEPRLLIGGTSSGQLVLWDIRSGRLPVQRSSLVASGSGRGHSHPLCSMEIIEGGSGLVTASTDGLLNFWSLSSLRDPAESVQLDAAVSSMAVAPVSNSLLCGDESGNLYAVSSASSTASSSGTASAAGGKSGSRRTVRKLEVAPDDGHFGMITSVSVKGVPQRTGSGGSSINRGFLVGAGGLVMTSGVDWTTKLWAPAITDKPLISLTNPQYDYMADVQWNPVNSALIATASTSGRVGLWNLATNLDEPITGSQGIVVDISDKPSSGVNRLKWSPDGRRIVVASADKVHVLGMSEDIWKVTGDEDVRMMNLLKSRGLFKEHT